MLSSPSRSSPSCSDSIAPGKRTRPMKPQPRPKAATSQPPSPAVQAKIQRLRTFLNDAQEKKTALKPSPTHPNHVVVTSTALLAALMTFHADWEVGDLDPAHIDVEVLRAIVAEGLRPCGEGSGSSSLEEWWKANGDVVVDLSRSRELDFERGARGRWREELGEETEMGSLLQFEVEAYYARVEDWEEGRWRWHGS